VDFLSSNTIEHLNIVKEMSATLSFDMGMCLARRDVGDMGWWVLTLDTSPMKDFFVLMCTPHGMLAEYNFQGEVWYGVIDDAGELLEHLQNAGYRCLTDQEMNEFSGYI